MKTIKLILVSIIIATTGFTQSINIPNQYTLVTEARLHDRFRWTRDQNGSEWSIDRLSP